MKEMKGYLTLELTGPCIGVMLGVAYDISCCCTKAELRSKDEDRDLKGCGIIVLPEYLKHKKKHISQI